MCSTPTRVRIPSVLSIFIILNRSDTRAHGQKLGPRETGQLCAGEERESGTRALGADVPALSRTRLSVFRPGEWEREKGRLVHENWVEAARARVKEGP
jgi:hypothetical protein